MHERLRRAAGLLSKYQNVEGKVATLKVPNVLEFGRVSDLRPYPKQGPHSSFSAI
jgi:hypothetical protein